MDPSEGSLHSRQAFIEYYGGTLEWDAASPASGGATATSHTAQTRTMRMQPEKKEEHALPIELVRTEDQKWGLRIALNEQKSHVVTNVVKGSASDRKIKVNDVLVTINGKEADSLDHDTIMAIVRSNLALDVTIHRPAVPKETIIIPYKAIEKHGGKLGMCLKISRGI